MANQAVLSLPDLLENLWQSHRACVYDIMGHNPETVWHSLDPGDPKLRNMTDVMAVPNWETITWPMILHWDGGVYRRKNDGSMFNDFYEEHPKQEFRRKHHTAIRTTQRQQEL